MTKSGKQLFAVALLAGVAICLYTGGFFLDKAAGEHGAKVLNDIDPQKAELVLNFQLHRVEILQEDARSAYDLAKVVLGALITVVLQLVGDGQQPERGGRKLGGAAADANGDGVNARMAPRKADQRGGA